MHFLLFFICLVVTPSLQAAKHYYLQILPTYPNVGMFAACNLVLRHLYLYHYGHYTNVKGLKVDFAERGAYYDVAQGSNWWNYYFEPIALGSSAHIKTILSSSHSLNEQAWGIRRRLSYEQACHIAKHDIKVRPYVLDIVNAFTEEHFQDFTVIGVHYRGTDKILEAPRVPYEEASATVAEQISLLPDNHYRIFVATDEQPFLDYMHQLFPGKVISTSCYRSPDLSNIHHSKKETPYKLGLEALTDCLLLSSCDLLIRTSSNFSLWATYFNPGLPVIMLSHRYGNTLE